jgi:hypothetical protein
MECDRASAAKASTRGWNEVPEALAALSDLPFAAIALRMCAVAVVVVTVALISEQVGPFLGAMVASLPTYTGPIFLFLALDFPPEHLARVAVAALAACGVIPVNILIYGLLARRGHSMIVSLMGSLAVWFACAIFVQLYDWTLIEALIFAIPIFAVALLLAPHFMDATPLRAGKRSWLDLAVRVLLVTSVVGLVNALSPFIPAQLTGIMAIVPIVTTSLIIVLHGRIGGPATAALLAHTVGGLIGMLLALAFVGYTVVAWGPALSLPIALAICVSWNLMLIIARHGRAILKRQPN